MALSRVLFDNISVNSRLLARFKEAIRLATVPARRCAVDPQSDRGKDLFTLHSGLGPDASVSPYFSVYFLHPPVLRLLHPCLVVLLLLHVLLAVLLLPLVLFAPFCLSIRLLLPPPRAMLIISHIPLKASHILRRLLFDALQKATLTLDDFEFLFARCHLF